MENDLLKQAETLFEKLKEHWGDLPDYVYSKEYKKTLLGWVQKNISKGKMGVKYLVVTALSGEINGDPPCFEFQRKKA